jgi:hypothetical protein
MLQRNASGSLKFTKMEATSGIKVFKKFDKNAIFGIHDCLKKCLGEATCLLWTTMEPRGQTSMQVGKT